MTRALLNEALRHWDLPPVESAEPMAGGTNNTLLAVLAGGRTWVLRRYGNLPADRVRAEHRLLAHVSVLGLPFAVPSPGPGRGDGRGRPRRRPGAVPAPAGPAAVAGRARRCRAGRWALARVGGPRQGMSPARWPGRRAWSRREPGGEQPRYRLRNIGPRKHGRC
ncbi:MAG: phosphotransferase [Oryzihumus sp.]